MQGLREKTRLLLAAFGRILCVGVGSVKGLGRRNEERNLDRALVLVKKSKVDLG